MVRDPLASEQATIGFYGRTTLDESPEMTRKVRLAVARSKEGDREALRFLYTTYAHNVYGYVHSIVHDDHDGDREI
jgi:RNA polymerase sigma-70 factor (ECF subfamily)